MADETSGGRHVGHWAVVTVLLYALAMVVITAPLLYAGMSTREPAKSNISFQEALEVYKAYPYWILIGVLTIICSVTLLVPMKIARRKNVTRRSWLSLAIAAGLLMGLLMGALTLVIGELIMRDDFFGNPLLWSGVVMAVAGWLFWGVIFFRYWRDKAGRSHVSRVMSKVLAGSIAEMLVAVPSHIYIREQTYCCAGAGTFTGMAFGFSVMLLGFGPGVFFLFMRRVERLRQPEVGEAKPNLGRHSRDALMWAGVATVWLLMAGGSRAFEGQGWIDPGAVTMLHEVLRLSFIVTGCCAFYHVIKAAIAREERWRWVLGAVLILAEVLVLVFSIA